MYPLIVSIILAVLLVGCEHTHCPVAKVKVNTPIYIQSGIVMILRDNWRYVCPVEEVPDNE